MDDALATESVVLMSPKVDPGRRLSRRRPPSNAHRQHVAQTLVPRELETGERHQDRYGFAVQENLGGPPIHHVDPAHHSSRTGLVEAPEHSDSPPIDAVRWYLTTGEAGEGNDEDPDPDEERRAPGAEPRDEAGGDQCESEGLRGFSADDGFHAHILTAGRALAADRVRRLMRPHPRRPSATAPVAVVVEQMVQKDAVRFSDCVGEQRTARWIVVWLDKRAANPGARISRSRG